MHYLTPMAKRCLVISAPVAHSDTQTPLCPLLSNGPSETVSDATGRFAMASLVYELETGVRAESSADSCGGLILPPIQTGSSDLNSLVEDGWRGRFGSTTDMLKLAESLGDGRDSRRPNYLFHVESRVA